MVLGSFFDLLLGLLEALYVLFLLSKFRRCKILLGECVKGFFPGFDAFIFLPKALQVRVMLAAEGKGHKLYAYAQNMPPRVEPMSRT